MHLFVPTMWFQQLSTIGPSGFIGPIPFFLSAPSLTLILLKAMPFWLHYLELLL